MPQFFELCLGLFGFSILTLVLRRVRFTKYSDAEKRKIIESHKRVTKVYRVLFWMSPLFAAAIYIVYKLRVSEAGYLVAIAAMGCFLVLEDYFFIKQGLRRLDK